MSTEFKLIPCATIWKHHIWILCKFWKVCIFHFEQVKDNYLDVEKLFHLFLICTISTKLNILEIIIFENK